MLKVKVASDKLQAISYHFKIVILPAGFDKVEPTKNLSKPT